MPSESRAGRAYELLRSQGLGIICGLSTVALLAVGSVVLAATREGASADIAIDDLRPFFERPSPVHAWFYLLFAVMLLYALNTLLATWHSVSRKWRAGNRRPSAYGAAVIHLGVLGAFAGHLVGGLWSQERGEVVLTHSWTTLPDGSQARLESFDAEMLPGGMPKSVRGAVQTRSASGPESAQTVGYNAPLSSGLGSELYLLSQFGEVLHGVELVSGAERCVATREQGCTLGGRDVRLLAVSEQSHFGAPLARIEVGGGASPEEVWVVAGRTARLADGRPIDLGALQRSPALALRGRHAPGNPIALVSALVVALGIALMWRRFVGPV